MSFQLQIGRFHGVVDRLYALLDSDAKSILSLKEEFVKFLFTFLPMKKKRLSKKGHNDMQLNFQVTNGSFGKEK